MRPQDLFIYIASSGRLRRRTQKTDKNIVVYDSERGDTHYISETEKAILS